MCALRSAFRRAVCSSFRSYVARPACIAARPCFGRSSIAIGALLSGSACVCAWKQPPVQMGVIRDEPQCVAMGDVIPTGPRGSGTLEKLGNMDVYVAGSGKRAIVLVHDIFGVWNSNMQRNCDVLAAAGFLVVMPDFFQGSGRGQPGFQRPTNEAVDAELLNKVVPFVKAKGATSIGLVGFCFGGGMAMRVANSDAFRAVGGIHASGLAAPAGEELAWKASVPFMLIQAKNDPSLEPIAKIIDEKTIGSECVLRQFYDHVHGFCGAGGDRLGSAVIRAAVADALSTTIKFFDRNL